MHFVRAHTKALNSVSYWISGIHASPDTHDSFNLSIVNTSRNRSTTHDPPLAGLMLGNIRLLLGSVVHRADGLQVLM